MYYGIKTTVYYAADGHKPNNTAGKSTMTNNNRNITTQTDFTTGRVRLDQYNPTNTTDKEDIRKRPRFASLKISTIAVSFNQNHTSSQYKSVPLNQSQVANIHKTL